MPLRRARGAYPAVVLEGMPRLVGGDAERGDAVAVVDSGREAQDPFPRVVVVAELARRLLDRDLDRAAEIQDLPGHLRSRIPDEAPTRLNLA